MNLEEYLKKAKRILKEDAGSEGLCYRVYYTGELKEGDFTIEDTKTTVDNKISIIKFNYPKDYGFALQYLKDLGNELIKLELLF